MVVYCNYAMHIVGCTVFILESSPFDEFNVRGKCLFITNNYGQSNDTNTRLWAKAKSHIY